MIQYRTGNALLAGERPVLFVHVVNDQGKWGAGFSGQLSRRYPQARTGYAAWSRDRLRVYPPFALGGVYVQAQIAGPLVGCAHLLAQRGCPGTVDYSALEESLRKLDAVLSSWPYAPTVVMPAIGCGLGHGSWERVEPLLDGAIGHRNPVVYVLASSTVVGEEMRSV